MRLLHLTAVGADRPSASLEFAPRLTVIYGASETGKTYVIDALDFMLGGRRLREIPEAAGYKHILLGIEFDDGDVVTLVRELRGGSIAVYQEDLRALPSRPADQVLLGQHQKDNENTISYFFLDRLGIADAKLRKNNRNTVQSLSLRNLAHLVLVDEEQMQSRLSPVESGIPTSRTAERSAFKLLLEGEDDSGLTEAEDPDAFRRVNQGQVDILDRAIGLVQAQLQGAPERPQCLEVLTRINESISQASSSMSIQLARRDRLFSQRASLQEQGQQGRENVGQMTALINRFTLLDEQYNADLARLQMVKEAGTLLGYLDADACVFCGADASHQKREHAVYETVHLAKSVDVETAKTEALRSDLALTVESVQLELNRLEENLLNLDATLGELNSQIAEVDQTLQPVQVDLDELISRRSQVERWVEQWNRMHELEQLRADVVRERPVPSDPVAEGFSVTTKQDFSSTLRRILMSWEVPGATDAVFTFEGSPDIRMQHRSRADRGKGIRSVLHAGFSVALSEYCVERGLPHPGFVALDTPVLTYRDADPSDAGPWSAGDREDELLSGSVAQAFYRYLSTEHSGQTIVLENQTPPEVDAPGCTVEFFTGNSTTGRAGFYPARQ